MSRTQTLQVPQHLAGTDLRPVLTLLPVAATDRTGGAEAVDAEGGAGATVVKGALGALVVAHLASAGLALKEAIATPDLVWDTAGIPKKASVAKIALVPFAGAAGYTRDIKPKLAVAADALKLQGG